MISIAAKRQSASRVPNDVFTHRRSQVNVWISLVLLLLTLTGAQAQRRAVPYVTADAGVNFLQEVEFRPNSSIFPVSTEAEFDPGYRFDVGIGYLLKEGGAFSYRYGKAIFDVAAEITAGMTYNQASSLGAMDLSSNGSSLELIQVPLMANIVFRFPVSERFSVSVGGGAGGLIAILQADSATASKSSEDDVLFAYQAIANLHYDFTEHFTTSVGYKYTGTSNSNFKGDFDVMADGFSSHWLGLTFNWVF